MDRHLSTGGVALLATKRFYFGVGGGTMELKGLVDAACVDATRNAEGRAPLIMEVVRVFADGSSNIREIISIRRGL